MNNDFDSLKKLEIQIREIACVDPELIYKAELSLFNERPAQEISIDEQSNFYVLHRYLFNVPEIIKTYQAFASFNGVPIKDGYINEIWPWSKKDNSSLSLTGFYKGYSGEFYNVPGEFNYLLEAYGYRVL